MVRVWTSCRVQVSFHVPSVALEWAATASSAMAASTGCSRLKRLTKDPDYRCTWCQGTARLLDSRPQRGPSRTWQAGGGSFLLLPRRHALSSWWLWTFNRITCENPLDEVQGAATSSLFLPTLFQDTWPRVQLLCVERNAPCQWDLATDKAKPPMSAAKWLGNDQTDLQCKTARYCHHQINELLARLSTEDLDLILKERRLRWYGHVECSNGAVKTAFDCRLMESVGLGGQRWHESSWQRGIAESGSSRLSTIMIDISGDHAASQLPGRRPTDVYVAPVLHSNQNSVNDDDDEGHV